MEIQPVSYAAEKELKPSHLSIKNLQEVELSLFPGDVKPKPRRRLNENHIDRADGLDILIQKTKAIGLRAGEEGLVSRFNELPNENGNEWLEALNNRKNLLWGMRKIRKYVCGGI